MALNNIPVSAPGLPVDLQTEMLQLARRRKIAEAMQANALSKSSPVTMVGRVAVPNWGDAIGSIADAIASKRASEGLDKEEQAVSQQYNQRLQKGVEDFANQVQGGPQSVGQDTRALDESGAQGAPPDAMMNLPPNPIKAIANAYGSGLPPLQEMGKAYLGNMFRGQVGLKDILAQTQHLSPQAASAWAIQQGYNLPPSFFEGRPKVNVSGDMAVTSTDGKVTGKEPIQTYGPVTTENGIPGQTSEQTGRFHGAQGGNVTPATNREKFISEADTKQLAEGRKLAQENVNGLQAVAKAQTLVKDLDPNTLGTLSNVRLAVNKTIQSLGGQPLPEGARVEELNAALGNLLIDKIRLFAPVTQQDITQMKQIVGSNTNTKVALGSMLNFMAQKLGRGIEQHNQFVDSMSTLPGADPEFRKRWGVDFTVSGANGFGGFEDQPAAPQPATPAASPPSIEDLVKKYGG